MIRLFPATTSPVIMRLAFRIYPISCLMSALFFAAATGTTSARADGLDLNLNDDAARLTYRHPVESRRLEVDGSWLHHQDNGDVASVGLHLAGNAGTEQNPVNAGIGGRVYFLDADKASVDGGVLAVGGFVRWKLPQANRVGIGGHLYFGPDVIAFGDAEQYFEAAVYVSYDILREAEAYIGLRNVKADFEDAPEVTFDTGMHVGIRLRF